MEHSHQAEKEFVRAKGVVRSRDWTAAGYSRVSLTRLLRAGEIQRLARGLYGLSDHGFTEWHDLALVALAVPSAVVSLVSALAFHGIGTQLPYETWIAVPERTRTPKLAQKLRVVRFSEPYFSAGITTHVVEGVKSASTHPQRLSPIAFGCARKWDMTWRLKPLRRAGVCKSSHSRNSTTLPNSTGWTALCAPISRP
ncbi:MAG: type IV toxin-antitoxin system AbiEi family antitoxin domain-containing protein [Chthonomonas sp.]|nr:type IV toxin-antitoxin system AbiEi family antitoxin domain-containing protein [Chthonomonas sp.]